MKKIISINLLIYITLVNIQAQGTVHISLDTLLHRVETNYPAVLQYQHNISSLQSKAEGAKAWMPPTFSTGLSRWPYDFSTLDDKNDPMNQAGILFSLEQMIPNPGKLNAKKNYLNSLVEIEKSKKEWTKNELRREAKILYYNRYIAEKKQLIVQESEQLLNLLLTTAEEQFSFNQSQITNIYKARARLAELKNMSLMLNALVIQSNIGINILLVRDINTPFEIDTLITPSNHSFSIPDTNELAVRSDIAAIDHYIQSMKLEQDVMKTGTRPDFGIRAEHMQMFGMPNQWSVMGMITIPIVPWSSKMYSSETQSIDFLVRSMEKEKQSLELTARKMQSEKLVMLSYETAQYRSYLDNIIPAYENNLQASMLAYKQNTGDFFVLLDAWEMLLMKKLEVYDKLLDILKLEAEYEYEKEIR